MSPIKTNNVSSELISQAARFIADADAILITAGAGIGVDSGMPDFRGDNGFWNAYPIFKQQGVANGGWFRREPEKAWGFYGQRLKLYRETKPHQGFSILKKWCEQKADYFIFTTNVDGHFQKAGFEHKHIYEAHGSIHHLQCSEACSQEIWQVGERKFIVDDSMCLMNEMPLCLNSNHIARPNILMFDDDYWLDNRSHRQWNNYKHWKQQLTSKNVVTIEIGAGKTVATARRESQKMQGVTIRIDPNEHDAESNTLVLAGRALDVLTKIDNITITAE